MITVLGLPPAEAVKRLTEAGYCVHTEEARSRKGVEGGEPRVIRQTERPGHGVNLTYASFITKPQA